jgi:hypothetical protein
VEAGLGVVILIAFQNQIRWIGLGGDEVVKTVRGVEGLSDNQGHVKRLGV